MFNKSLFLIALLALPAFCYSQADFRVGYIVTNSNDTIQGLIDYKGNISNASKCVFKTKGSSKPTAYGPLDIKLYRFYDSKCYVSKYVGWDEKEDFRFLEYLVNGVVDVFYFRDGSGDHYFVENEDGRLLYLNNEEKETYVHGKKYTAKSKDYVGTLRYTLRESSSVSRRLDHLSLDHKSLIEVANTYHSETCSTEECIIYEKNLLKAKWEFGPLIGANISNLVFNGTLNTSDTYLGYTPMESDLFWVLGVFGKLNMPHVNERLFLQLEGTLSRRSFETDRKALDRQSDGEHKVDMVFKVNSFNNSALIRYESPKGTVRPVFQTGIFVDYFFGHKFDATIDYSYGTQKEIEGSGQNDRNIPFNNLNVGLSTGAGAIFTLTGGNYFFVDLRYQRGVGLLKGVNSNQFMLNLGMRLQVKGLY
ncbi:MAG: hypothetical protein ABJG41_12045 [Cyclobacteriaceae bacterium]